MWLSNDGFWLLAPFFPVVREAKEAVLLFPSTTYWI